MAAITQAEVPQVQRARVPSFWDAVWSWLTTVDAKRIGILYGVSAFIFFLIAGVEAMIMRVQLYQPNERLVSADVFDQLFTMHGTTMIFLVIMPLGAAFFNYIVPLMIGARDVAFPRLNAWSYWAFIAGGILLHISYIFGGAPNVGWFGYANLTEAKFNPGHGVDFWLFGLQLLGFASLAAAFNFMITIINMRAPGMKLMRMPPFAWMTLLTPCLMILAFPVLTVARFELMFARIVYTNFFTTAAVAQPPLYFAIGFISMFIIGGLSGIMHASPPPDLQQHGTYFVVAHLHYVLFGGSIFGLFAGLHYWFPKFTGRLLNERLAKWTFWTMFIGMNITFMPM